MRRFILSFHLANALIAGAFMMILGATGSIIALEAELDRLSHPHVSYLTPSSKVPAMHSGLSPCKGEL